MIQTQRKNMKGIILQRSHNNKHFVENEHEQGNEMSLGTFQTSTSSFENELSNQSDSISLQSYNGQSPYSGMAVVSGNSQTFPPYQIPSFRNSSEYVPYSSYSVRNQSYSQPIDYGYADQPYLKGNTQLSGYEDYSYPVYGSTSYSPYFPYSPNYSWKNSDPLPNPAYGMNSMNYPYTKSATMNIVNSDSSSTLYGESAYRMDMKDSSLPMSCNSSLPSSFSQSQMLPTSPSSLSSQPLYHFPQQGSILTESPSLTIKKEKSIMTGNQTSCFHTVEDVKYLHQKDCFVTMIDPVKKADLNNRGVNDVTGSTGSSSSGVSDTTGSTGSGVNDSSSSGVNGSSSSGVNDSSSSGVNDSTGSSNSTGVTRSNISTHSIYQNSSSSKPSSSSTRKNHRKNGRITESSNQVLTIDLNKLDSDNRTTLMIRNIPNGFQQEVLLKIMNNYIPNRFDFFYLPLDFHTTYNLGYCYINVIDVATVRELYLSFHNKHWPNTPSQKTCQVCYARIQGTQQMIENSKDWAVMHLPEQFRPVFFEPVIQIINGKEELIMKRIDPVVEMKMR